MAEIESSALTRQCLNRRLPDTDTVHRKTTAWVKRRNGCGAPTQWRFTTEDARIKLHSLYPKVTPCRCTRSTNQTEPNARHGDCGRISFP